MVDIVDLMNKFKDKITACYPELYIDFEYDSELDEYDIWHNNPELEFKDDKFIKLVGEVAREIFFNNNIYNFSFGYDYYKSKEIEDKSKEYTVKNTKIDKVNVNFFNLEQGMSNYSKNITKKESFNLTQASIDISLKKIGPSFEPYLLVSLAYITYNNTFIIDDIKEVA
jgi:hypothetical protein